MGEGSTPGRVILYSGSCVNFIRYIVHVTLSNRVNVRRTTIVSYPLYSYSAIATLRLSVMNAVFVVRYRGIGPRKATLCVIRIVLPVSFFSLRVVPVRSSPRRGFHAQLVFGSLTRGIVVRRPGVASAPRVLLVLTLGVGIILYFSFYRQFAYFLFLIWNGGAVGPFFLRSRMLPAA